MSLGGGGANVPGANNAPNARNLAIAWLCVVAMLENTTQYSNSVSVIYPVLGWRGLVDYVEAVKCFCLQRHKEPGLEASIFPRLSVE